MLTITFEQSRSINYKKVLSLCMDFDNFSEKNGCNKLELTATEIFQKWNTFSTIHHYATRWASCRVYYRDELIVPYSTRLFYALQDIKTCISEQKIHTCRLSNIFPGWGCKQIRSIKRHIEYFAYVYWYSFGCFIGENVWMVDKGGLLNRLTYEANMTFLSECPFFDKSKIEQAVKALPSKILIDNIHWTKEYKEDFSGDKVEYIPLTITHIPQVNEKPKYEDALNILLSKAPGELSDEEINLLIDLKTNRFKS